MSTEKARGRILTVCVSLAKEIWVNGQLVTTGIFKEPVEQKLVLRKLNLDGDEQADLTVHGGPEKALYTYASEHYPWWKEQMPDMKFSHGIFGENLTTEGLLETETYIGDEFEAGTAVIRVTQPRIPCYKLGIRFGRTDIIKRFMKSGRNGLYFAVVKEGILGPGDEIRYLRGDEYRIKVSDVIRLFTDRHNTDLAFIKRALQSQLAEQMKGFIANLDHF